MFIKQLKARKILATNSRPTIEVELTTNKGAARASVPFGTSKSKWEVKYLPADEALKSFLKIKRHFIGEFDDQQEVDDLLHIIDKTEDFSLIGGNVALAISAAALKAFALEEGKEVFEFLSDKPSMPKPLANVVGGWKGQSDIQEFLVAPIHQNSFSESIMHLADLYWRIGNEIAAKDKYFKFSKNLESAWVTFLSTEEVLDIITKVVDENTAVGLDVAASSLWDGERYSYSDKTLTTMQQIEYMVRLAKKYKLFYLEDPIREDDFVSFSTITKNAGCLVCGDDIYATNPHRLKQGLDIKATNAVLVKPNQVGTISDTIEFVRIAKENGLKTVLSHRSGETDDVLMCHLAVGLGADYIKLGISGERVVKINEMIRIEEKLGRL